MDWATAPLDDTWVPVGAVKGPQGRLAASLMPPVRVVETFPPVSERQGPENSVVIDLGKNIAGWVELALPAHTPAGTIVTMEFGEQVDAQNNVINPYVQVDHYIFSGKENGSSWWRPTFVYHGFRFVQITGSPPPPSSSSLRLCDLTWAPRSPNFALNLCSW